VTLRQGQFVTIIFIWEKIALHQFDYDHDNQMMASKDSPKNIHTEASPEKSFCLCLPWLLRKEFPT
jgi:hypothetical protein